MREAVRASLRGFQEVEESGDAFETGWSPEYEAGRLGWLLAGGYVCRVRHRILLEGSTVAVRSRVERRAPGGPRSGRWERVDGGPAARGLLEDIARHLEADP